MTGISTSEKTFGAKQVTGVETNCGTIRTNCVLNASGVWSRKIAQMVNLDIPLMPMKHAYIVTDSMKEVKGVPNVRDHDFKIYFKVNGESLSIGGYELNPIILGPVCIYAIFINTSMKFLINFLNNLFFRYLKTFLSVCTS